MDSNTDTDDPLTQEDTNNDDAYQLDTPEEISFIDQDEFEVLNTSPAFFPKN